MCYEAGHGITRDIARANAWYEKAAENGHIEALSKLRSLKQKSEEEQLVALRKRAVVGVASAQNQLGAVFELKREDDEAFFWFKKAAEHQDVDGMYNFARMYHMGRGIEKNERLAKEWYKKASDKGHLKAAYDLAELYTFGITSPKNKKASECAKIVIDEQIEYGYSSNTNRNIGSEIRSKIDAYREKIRNQLRNSSYSSYSSSDDREAFSLYESLAAKGNARAQSQLGVFYYTGKGTRENREEASKWWSKASDLGNIAAKTYLGVMYIKGQGVVKDESKAIPLFQTAADLGDTHAMYNLALLYAEGKGASQNAQKATELLTQAIEYVH